VSLTNRSRSLAVFIPGWVGDAVMATPALLALREAHPGWRVVGVGKPAPMAVLEGLDLFDEQVVCAGKGWHKGTLEIARRIRPMRISKAVLLSNSFRTALSAWLGGCGERVGLAMHGRGLLLSRALQPTMDDAGRRAIHPALLEYNRIAEAAGTADPGRRLRLATRPQDEAAAEQVWGLTGLGDRPVVVLNPGAAFGQAKFWPRHYFAELAGRLAGQGFGVLVLCGPAEAQLAQAIASDADHPQVQALAHPRGPDPSLGLSKACVRRSALLVTTDSGPRHFAQAFDVPVVTLFGPTHIGWTETWHPRSTHLQKQLDCGPCQQRVCPRGHHRCMTELTVDEVHLACMDLLGLHGGHGLPMARSAG